MSRTVLSFGEMLWDLLPGGPALGGAPFNFAYRVHSLGDRGLMVTRLGTDGLGRRAFQRAEGLGMDTRLIQWEGARPTGTVNVTLDAAGDPDFHIVPDVAYDRIAVTEELLAAAAGSACVCFGTLVQRAEPSRSTLAAVLAAARGVRFLDINLRKDCYTRRTVAASLERAEVLKLNDAEAGELARMFGLAGGLAEFCDGVTARFSLTHCLVTLGERGALAASADGAKVYEPGYRVEVVDTCGSGDAAAAGFVHRLLAGADLGECCRFGNALGAMVARQHGATTPVTPAEIEDFLARPPRRIVEPALKEFSH